MPKPTIQRTVRMILLITFPTAVPNIFHPVQSQRKGRGSVMRRLEYGIDQRRQRRPLRKYEEEGEQCDENEEREQPPLLADREKLPELAENGELTKQGMRRRERERERTQSTTTRPAPLCDKEAGFFVRNAEVSIQQILSVAN